jgi:O-succinylbenzoate synthase
VRIDAVELRVIRLELLRPFVTSIARTEGRDVLLVRVRGDGIDGWGECAADATGGYWHETIDSAWSAVTARANGHRTIGQPMADAAFEMAMLDAELRAAQTSLAEHLDGTRTVIDATATVGFDDDVDALLAAGYRSVKLKVAPDRIPQSFPADVAVQVDGNGSFAGRPDQVLLLDELGLLCIEQPMAPDDLQGHAALVRQLHTAVCLDESIASKRDLDNAVRVNACDAVCVKPSRLGGLANAKVVHDVAQRQGLSAKVGGMLETGLGRAAALALASLPGFTLPADLSASDRYWAEDVTEPFVLDADLGRQTRASVSTCRWTWSNASRSTPRSSVSTDSRGSDANTTGASNAARRAARRSAASTGAPATSTSSTLPAARGRSKPSAVAR